MPLMLPSYGVYVNVSIPEKFVSGLYSIWLLLIRATPFKGCVRFDTLSVLESISVSFVSIDIYTEAPDLTVALSSMPTGVSLTLSIAIVMLASFESTAPSLTLKLKLSVPLKLPFGV